MNKHIWYVEHINAPIYWYAHPYHCTYQSHTLSQNRFYISIHISISFYISMHISSLFLPLFNSYTAHMPRYSIPVPHIPNPYPVCPPTYVFILLFFHIWSKTVPNLATQTYHPTYHDPYTYHITSHWLMICSFIHFFHNCRLFLVHRVFSVQSSLYPWKQLSA